MELYNENKFLLLSLRREYPPLSLLQLQKMIDTDRVDISQPLDLSVICNTGLYTIDPMSKHFGIQLTDEVSQYTSAYGQSSFLDTE
jgi:large subunit ribosomal protein L15